MSLTALIDGDVFVYQAAARAEHEIEWGDGDWTLHANASEGKSFVDDLVHEVQEALNADRVVIALSSPENFRKKIFPAYKGNRKNVRKPILYKALRAYFHEAYETVERPSLEGDDVLGILATMLGNKYGKDKIIVSIDKDMKSVPGRYWNGSQKDDDGNPLVLEISEEEADRWHMIQTLSGDPVDGYSGCPGVGTVQATKAITAMTKAVPYDHLITRGPRKGETEIRTREEPCETLWEVVVSRYEAAGLTEEDALIQARLARILRCSDYDFEKKEPILWSPSPCNV